MSEAEKAFEEFWSLRQCTLPPKEYIALKYDLRSAYLAATERTARRCEEICNEGAREQESNLKLEPGNQDIRLGHARDANAIAKEFGLD